MTPEEAHRLLHGRLQELGYRGDVTMMAPSVVRDLFPEQWEEILAALPKDGEAEGEQPPKPTLLNLHKLYCMRSRRWWARLFGGR